jgi:hypothetical protein
LQSAAAVAPSIAEEAERKIGRNFMLISVVDIVEKLKFV